MKQTDKEDGAPHAVVLCCHCGNTAPSRFLYRHEADLLYEQDHEKKYLEPFRFFALACMTCEGLSVRGGFVHAHGGSEAPSDYPRLYPEGPGIVPPLHTLAGKEALPTRVAALYEEAWPLRHLAPSALANQIRRALELICVDQEAKGKTLYDQLTDLASRGIFPTELAELAHLLREIGNRGSHAGQEVDVWDAELADELFKSLLRYVYIAPSHVRRMRQRLSV